jgi:deoxyadenosine/deoxycytidine kinase
MSAQMIVIEGIIGVGKSTLSQDLAKLLGYHFLKEPVEDNPYLEQFYANPKRYALEMQFWLMSKRFTMHQEAIELVWRTGQGVVMDRSIYGDRVFAEQNYLDKNIDKAGLDNYLNMSKVMTQFLMVPHLTLYLDASPKTCQQRIKHRLRNCERQIPLNYLEGLTKLYKNLMLQMKQLGSNVINFDWENFHDADYVLETIKEKGLLTQTFSNYHSISKNVLKNATSRTHSTDPKITSII